MRSLLYVFLFMVFLTKTELAQTNTPIQSSTIIHNMDSDSDKHKNKAWAGVSSHYHNIDSLIKIEIKIISHNPVINSMVAIFKREKGWGAYDK